MTYAGVMAEKDAATKDTATILTENSPILTENSPNLVERIQRTSFSLLI